MLLAMTWYEIRSIQWFRVAYSKGDIGHDLRYKYEMIPYVSKGSVSAGQNND